jgi:hypothetical protein
MAIYYREGLKEPQHSAVMQEGSVPGPTRLGEYYLSKTRREIDLLSIVPRLGVFRVGVGAEPQAGVVKVPTIILS